MLFQRTFFAAILICITCNSCSPRLIRYNRDTKRVLTGEMSEVEFDNEFYSLCPPPYQEKNHTHWLRYEGCYVWQDKNGWYQVYKFFPRGRAMRTYKMDTYPDNLTLLTIAKEKLYFDTEGFDLKVEYLHSRDWKLHNIIMTGTVGQDTITLSGRQNLRPPYDKTRIDMRLIYDSTLTALM